MSRIKCTNKECPKSFHLSYQSMENAHNAIYSSQEKSKRNQNDNLSDIKSGFVSETIESPLDFLNSESIKVEGASGLSSILNDKFGDNRFEVEKERGILVDYETEAVIHDIEDDKYYRASGSYVEWGWGNDSVEYYHVCEVKPYNQSIPSFIPSEKSTDDIDSSELNSLFSKIFNMYKENEEQGDIWYVDDGILEKLEQSKKSDNIEVYEVHPEDSDIENDVIANSVDNQSNGEYQNARSARGAYIVHDKTTGEALTFPYIYHSEDGLEIDFFMNSKGKLYGIDVLDYSGDIEERRFKAV